MRTKLSQTLNSEEILMQSSLFDSLLRTLSNCVMLFSGALNLFWAFIFSHFTSVETHMMDLESIISLNDIAIHKTDPGAWFVLIGGDAAQSQGGPPESRYLEHASLPFVGSAYAMLRGAGIPRSRIITICQLNDTLEVLRAGARGDLQRYGNGSRIPAVAYQAQLTRTETNCSLLIEEGGVDYDGQSVNPGTVWNVLLGQHISQSNMEKVVPVNASTVFFAIYSHGDSHQSVSEANQTNVFKNEWFCHFPYESSKHSMYEFVATEHASGNPKTYLYATQLRAIFVHLFTANPKRSVVGLLNYCLSGGSVEFMRRSEARKLYQSHRWPLFLMCSTSSQADALVGGLWQSWFECLSRCLRQYHCDKTLHEMYNEVLAAYRHANRYELMNHIQSIIYPDLGDVIGTDKDPFARQLYPLLSSGDRGFPNWKGINNLQKAYKQKGIQFRSQANWKRKMNLTAAIKQAIEQTTKPELVFGEDSGVQAVKVSNLFSFDRCMNLSCELEISAGKGETFDREKTQDYQSRL